MLTLYATLESAVAVIHQQQGEWRADLALVGSQPQCLAQDPLHPEQLYCGTFDQGVWRSLDAGTSWKHIDDGITQKQITSVAVSPLERVHGHSVVYVGSEPSTLFRSED